MTAARDLRHRATDRWPQISERVAATRKPPPPTRADIEQILASADRMSDPPAAVMIRVPRSKAPSPGARIRLLGRTGPLSAEGRGIVWEPCGACSGWWTPDSLREWVAS